MKISKATGLRTAVAASGAALLMFVAGCGGSDEANSDDGTEQGAESGADASGEDSAAEEDPAAADTADEEEPADDAGADDAGTEDNGAEEAAEEDSGDDGSDAPAAGVVSPGEGFDPCDAISADDVNGVLDSELDEGSSNEMSSFTMCTFADMNTGESVIVQWAPVPGDLSQALDTMADMYSALEEPEEVTVSGTQEAAVLSGEVQGFGATILVATVDGGFIQVVATGEDMTNDQAVQIAETTLAGV